MATFDVFNMKREKVGSIDLADEVFGTEVREHLFYEVVKAQLASKRQGTQCAKNRSAVSGSTKKLYKQKGTGRARHGSIRAPVYVGGGRAHPPRPRDWAYEPPRRVRALALTSALSKFGKEGRLLVVDRFELGEVKTKKLVEALDALKAEHKTLVVDSQRQREASPVDPQLQGAPVPAARGRQRLRPPPARHARSCPRTRPRRSRSAASSRPPRAPTRADGGA